MNTISSHPEIVTNDIPSILNRNMLAGNRKPPLLLAFYGLGKSYQAAKFAVDQDMHYIDYRAPFKTFNDVRGYGIPNRETRKMEFLPDEDFDFVEGKRNLLHFEEVLNAAPAVQKVLMQVMLDRRIGKMALPEDTFVMASSNRLAHKTGVERMLAALADRFSIFHVRPDFSSYKTFLEDNGKSPEVLAFLNTNSDAPYNFDIKKWDGESNLPTFRSFDRLDDLAASYVGGTPEMAADPLFTANATSCIGPKYGPMFSQFIKLTDSIGDVGKMVDEADTCRIPSEADLKWIIACRLITIAEKENMANVFTLAHRLSVPHESNWKINTEPSAMQTFVATSIRRRRTDLMRTPEMLDWHQLYADTLTSI